MNTYRPTCGKCGGVMTPADSRIRPELFLHDACLPAELMEARKPARPRVVCLCGSTRFGEAYGCAMRDETLAGKIVLTVGLLGHAEGIDMNGPVKAMLDELHLRKIDLADEILVLNVGSYVGESTRREIAYAERHGKPVRYLEEKGGASR